jgi:cytochrome d ubiquinol oxidase subunit II
VLVLGWVNWTRNIAGGADVPGPVEVLAVIAAIAAARAAVSDYDGWAFTASAIAIAATVGSIFIDLYPNVMISSTNSRYNLTVSDAASGHYALTVMTVVSVIFLPLVLLYQGWSFHVFHGRIKAPPATPEPAGGSVPPPPQKPDAAGGGPVRAAPQL